MLVSGVSISDETKLAYLDLMCRTCCSDKEPYIEAGKSALPYTPPTGWRLDFFSISLNVARIVQSYWHIQYPYPIQTGCLLHIHSSCINKTIYIYSTHAKRLLKTSNAPVDQWCYVRDDTGDGDMIWSCVSFLYIYYFCNGSKLQIFCKLVADHAYISQMWTELN